MVIKYVPFAVNLIVCNKWFSCSVSPTIKTMNDANLYFDWNIKYALNNNINEGSKELWC